MDRTLNDVRAFFLEHPFVGLVLPDGWFGRLYDNWLQYSRIHMSGDELRTTDWTWSDEFRLES